MPTTTKIAAIPYARLKESASIGEVNLVTIKVNKTEDPEKAKFPIKFQR